VTKNGRDLTDRHLSILRAIYKLQPCGAYAIARETMLDTRYVEQTIYYTLSRRGLVEWAIIRAKGEKPRRKTGTLRLTAEGERALNEKIPIY
jgi:DNA-binding MarR family transcriptional regulator